MASSLVLSLGVLLLSGAAGWSLWGRRPQSLRVWGLCAVDLEGDPITLADGYVKVRCGSAPPGQTMVLQNNANPCWDDEFLFSAVSPYSVLNLEVWDADLWFNDYLGACATPIRPGVDRVSCDLTPAGSTLSFNYSYD